MQLYELIHVSETVNRALRQNAEGILMDRRSGNRPKKTKTQTADKNRLDVYKYSKMLFGVLYNEEENNNIVTLGPNKVSVTSGGRKSVIGL